MKRNKILLWILVIVLFGSFAYGVDSPCYKTTSVIGAGTRVFCPEDVIMVGTYGGTPENPTINLGKGLETTTLPVRIGEDSHIQVQWSNGEWYYLMDEDTDFIGADPSSNTYIYSEENPGGLDISKFPRDKDIIPVIDGGRGTEISEGIITYSPGAEIIEEYYEYEWRTGQIDSIKYGEYLGKSIDGYEYYEVTDSPEGEGIIRVPPSDSDKYVSFYKGDISAAKSKGDEAVQNIIRSAVLNDNFYDIEKQDSGKVYDDSLTRSEINSKLPAKVVPTTTVTPEGTKPTTTPEKKDEERFLVYKVNGKEVSVKYSKDIEDKLKAAGEKYQIQKQNTIAEPKAPSNQVEVKEVLPGVYKVAVGGKWASGMLDKSKAEELAKQEKLKIELKDAKLEGTTDKGELVIKSKDGYRKVNVIIGADGKATIQERGALAKGDTYTIHNTKIKNAKVMETYSINGEGDNVFQYASIDGHEQRLEKTTYEYVKSAIRSAGKSISIRDSAGGFTILSGQRRVLSLDQSGSRDDFTLYDNAGMRKRTITRDQVGDYRQTTHDTIYSVMAARGTDGKILKDDNGNTLYTQQGIRYSFEYDNEGRYSGRSGDPTFIYVDESGKEYTMTYTKDGKHVFTNNPSPELQKIMTSSYRQARSREVFATIDYAFNAFSGMGFYSSLFMSYDQRRSWINAVDEIFNNVILGGPRYWVSEICENQYDMSTNSLAYAEKPNGLKMPSAHIEAEKSEIIPIPYGDSVQDGRMYKMTFYAEATYSDVKFNVYLIGGDKETALFKEDIILEGEEDGEGDSYIFNCERDRSCVQYSFNEYDRICMIFEEEGELEIEGDELCNKIPVSDYSYNNYINSDESLDVYQPEEEQEDEDLTSEDTQKQDPVQI